MKKNSVYKQKGMKVGGAGGFFNQLMSHNSSVPEVGKGATILYYSDRHAYEVLEVNEKKKSCVIQRYEPERIDNLGMSDSQHYKYEKLSGDPIKLVWRWGSWKKEGYEYHFTEEALKKYSDNYNLLHEMFKLKGGKYTGAFIGSEIEGLTKKHKYYETVNIIFGLKQEYYDFTF